MRSNETEKNPAPVDAPEADSRESGLGIGSRIAPAVALLLIDGSAYADSADPDFTTIPEPSTLALLAAGGVVAGAARYLRKKSQK